jgi:hypothetical protein
MNLMDQGLCVEKDPGANRISDKLGDIEYRIRGPAVVGRGTPSPEQAFEEVRGKITQEITCPETEMALLRSYGEAGIGMIIKPMGYTGRLGKPGSHGGTPNEPNPTPPFLLSTLTKIPASGRNPPSANNVPLLSVITTVAVPARISYPDTPLFVKGITFDVSPTKKRRMSAFENCTLPRLPELSAHPGDSSSE